MNDNRLFTDPQTEIFRSIRAELARAKKKYPRWPVHIVARAGIVCEEAGELIRECLQVKYDSEGETADQAAARTAAMRKEAIQVAVTAIRFLENLK